MVSSRIGVDLVPFQRVRELLTSDVAALSRMLSPDEVRLSYDDQGPDIPGIAGRLAAKEAVFKLFHAAGGPLPWLGIEILRADGGWPLVRLRGRASALARDAGVRGIDVSITHDEPCAIAVAVCVEPPSVKSSSVEFSGVEFSGVEPVQYKPIVPKTTLRRTDMAAIGIDEVRDWILSRHPNRKTVDFNENIIENRLVDSLSFVELVYAIENASGAEIDFDNIDIQDFQTLASIEKAFFVPA